MRVEKIQLIEFKRFDNLTIDLGDNPAKIIALVGPNGCGKSSIFDAFEEQLKNYRAIQNGTEQTSFFSKAMFYENATPATPYNRSNSIRIKADTLLSRTSFYIRTAYRFTAKINVNKLKGMPEILQTSDEPTSSITLDTRLINNYQRLSGQSYEAFMEGTRTGDQVREEIMGKINQVLEKILDIKLTGLGNVVKVGQLYFQKGNAKKFPYDNLSSGEKEVVDIIIDLIVKTAVYHDTVFCIDEPELHLNTSIQRKLLVEIDKLIPDTCQLWVATHSIGFLRALQEELREKSQVLDFSERDFFTGAATIVPMKTNRANWQRIFSTALEDLTGLLAPRRIIYTEGRARIRDTTEKGMDAKVFNQVFGEAYSDTLFVSSGGNTELDQRSEIAIAILGKVFEDLEIWLLKDRDFDSGNQTDEARRKLYLASNPINHRVLNRWEIENYLFDKEILKKYSQSIGQTFNETKFDVLVTDIVNQNVKDELNFIKACCGISFSINENIFKVTLAGFITPDTAVYLELENCIFKRQ